MKKLLTLAGVAAIFAGPAFANGEHMERDWFASNQQLRISDKMVKFDANRDGVVTTSEVRAASHEKYANMDMNRDGMITRDELAESKSTKKGKSYR